MIFVEYDHMFALHQPADNSEFMASRAQAMRLSGACSLQENWRSNLLQTPEQDDNFFCYSRCTGVMFY